MKENKNSEKTKVKNSNAENQQREEKKVKFKHLTDKQKSTLEKAAVGGAGISFGAIVMALMGSTISQDNDKEVTPPSNTDNRKAGGNDMEVPIFTEAPFSDAVNDDMSFNEAFGAARKDIGPGGFFEWHGETYNTYYKEEWDALSPDERNDFFASVDDRHPNDGIVDEHEILDILNDDPNDDEINIDAEDVVINEKEEYEEVDMSDEDMVVIEPEHVPDDHHDDDIVYDDIDDDPYDHHNGDIIDNDPYDNDLDISDLG